MSTVVLLIGALALYFLWLMESFLADVERMVNPCAPRPPAWMRHALLIGAAGFTAAAGVLWFV